MLGGTRNSLFFLALLSEPGWASNYWARRDILSPWRLCRRQTNQLLETNVDIEMNALFDHQSKTPSIITEYINNTDFKILYPKFTDFDVRFYVFELLKVSCTPEGRV